MAGLLAREFHFPATIAELYDPARMPANLRAAHERNDESKPVKLTEVPAGYADWLGDIKTQIHGAQQGAGQALNLELVSLY